MTLRAGTQALGAFKVRGLVCDGRSGRGSVLTVRRQGPVLAAALADSLCAVSELPHPPSGHVHQRVKEDPRRWL